MTTRAYPETTGQQIGRGWRFGVIDAVVVLAIFALLWLVIALSGDMRAQFDGLTAQAKDFAEHAQKVATEAAQPAKESISSFKTSI